MDRLNYKAILERLKASSKKLSPWEQGFVEGTYDWLTECRNPLTDKQKEVIRKINGKLLGR